MELVSIVVVAGCVLMGVKLGDEAIRTYSGKIQEKSIYDDLNPEGLTLFSVLFFALAVSIIVNTC